MGLTTGCRCAEAIAGIGSEAGFNAVTALVVLDEFVGVCKSEFLFLSRKSYGNGTLLCRKPFVGFFMFIKLF